MARAPGPVVAGPDVAPEALRRESQHSLHSEEGCIDYVQDPRSEKAFRLRDRSFGRVYVQGNYPKALLTIPLGRITGVKPSTQRNLSKSARAANNQPIGTLAAPAQASPGPLLVWPRVLQYKNERNRRFFVVLLEGLNFMSLSTWSSEIQSVVCLTSSKSELAILATVEASRIGSCFGHSCAEMGIVGWGRVLSAKWIRRGAAAGVILPTP